jgi:hypothetical protein
MTPGARAIDPQLTAPGLCSDDACSKTSSHRDADKSGSCEGRSGSAPLSLCGAAGRCRPEHA